MEPSEQNNLVRIRNIEYKKLGKYQWSGTSEDSEIILKVSSYLQEKIQKPFCLSN